jgi:hypothetical protein
MRLVVLVLAFILVGGCTPVGGDPDPPPGPAASEAAGQLDALVTASARPMSGYSREKFPHWRRVDENCDVRDAVLKRDGTGVETSRTCKVLRGSWFSVYDAKTYTDPGQLDIDHMVPLANAWRSGADVWTEDQRTEFANDLTRPQLIAVSASTNRSKGDQDPAQWKPPNRDYWCEYARRWIAVKFFWKLTATDREKSTLREMLESCRVQNSAPPTYLPAPVA